MLVLTGCVLSGCGQTQGANLIDGVRTDPDQQGLVVSYTGGACDKSAHLKVTETPTRIDADVVVRSSRGSCTAEGIPRLLSARLDAPVGTRAIWSGGRQQIPFDGARLLAPAALPAGFTGLTEMGFADQPSEDAGVAKATTTWVTSRFDPAGATVDGPCRPTRGSLEVRLGPASASLARGLDKVGTAGVKGVEAQVFRGGSTNKPRFWAYGWTAGRGSVVVSSGPRCSGDQILSRSELLQVAESLRPA